MFIHSCSHGKVDNLVMKHLNMDNIKDHIERKEIYYRKTLWLKKMEDTKENTNNLRNKRPDERGGGGGGGGMNCGQGNYQGRH